MSKLNDERFVSFKAERPAKGIHEVARAAGVSVTTVSHAMSGKGRVSEETRLRVHEVARRLGYRPNVVAQGLASGRRGVLALQVSGAEGPALNTAFDYFAQVSDGATVSAIDLNYWLTFAPPSSNVELWRETRIDGAIIVDPVISDPLLEMLTALSLPFVTAGRSMSSAPDTYWVDNDHVKGTTHMLDHLARQGARRIALLATPAITSYTIDATTAYERWVRSRHQDPLIGTVRGSASEGDAYATALELLDNPLRPDAIYGTLDRLALGALLAARTRGLAVPDDLLIAGLTDSAAARTTDPPLTTLNLHPVEIGRKAVEVLVALVEGRPASERHHFVTTRVVPRESTVRSRGRKQLSLPAH